MCLATSELKPSRLCSSIGTEWEKAVCKNNPSNNLLRVMRQSDLNVLQQNLEIVQANKGTVLHKQGAEVTFAYFPCGAAMAAFQVLLPDGKAVETGLIGREGAVGGIVSQGYLPAFTQTRVLFPGEFLRIELVQLEAAKLRSQALRNLFARYADCLLAQLFQSAACNATHPIEQRTAKWLHCVADHTGFQEIPVTQDELASMLGVGHTYLSRVIQKFKSEHLIDTGRGRFRVLDAKRLEGLCCGCYRAVRQHFDTVLRHVYP
jgi:Crp-like helix-turn-helix domain